MKLLPFWDKLSLNTKLSLLFVSVLFFAIPITAFSVKSLKDIGTKAACIGDCYYPDPTVSWTKEPLYQIETCLNTTSRGSAYCSKRNQTGGTSINLQIASNFNTYYWVETLLYSDYPNVQWVSYSNGQKTCSSSSSTCGTTISWPAPVQSAQATLHGDPSKNPCSLVSGVSTCSSNQSATYPSKTVTFVDFPANTYFDVYTYIKGQLFDIQSNINSGAATAFSKPTIQSPAYGSLGISTNPTFQWTRVDGASRYAVWVSESNNFSTGPYWSTETAQTACGSSCNKVWGSGGWTARNGASGIPTSLVAGKTYYWLVWACLLSSCPLDGLTSIYNFTTAITTQTPPVIQSPSNGATNVINNPSFTWTPSAGATSYGIGLSTNPDILSFSGLYRSIVYPSACTTVCNANWNNGARWLPLGSIGAKPYVLDPGKTYYWFVWACNATECPLSGIAQASFTVGGAISQVSPSLISPLGGSNIADGKPTFVWSPASGATIDRYKLLIKPNSSNFSIGNFWSTDVNTLICYGKPNCSVPLDSSGWAWVKGDQDNNQSPPVPLNGGRWWWIVIACKNTTCDYANILASNVGAFSVPVGTVTTSATNLQPSNITAGNCDAGKVNTNFTWTLPAGATNATFYLSTQNNGFAPGTFLSTPLSFGGSLPTSNWTWPGLIPNTTHYWKIATQVGGGWYDSTTANFKTATCQVSGGLAYDLSRPGNPDDVFAYIGEVAGNATDPRTGYFLADVMSVTLAGESSGSDCAYHVDPGPHPTLGIFQYDASTWQGGPATNPDGSNEALNNYDSGSLLSGGSRKVSGCWRAPGVDTALSQPDSFSTAFGGTNDANIWDPYAQVRQTAKYFLAKQGCRWSVYGIAYGGCGY